MTHHRHWKRTLLIIVLGLVVLGGIGYEAYLYRRALQENERLSNTIQQLWDRVSQLQESLFVTQDEKTNLTGALEETQNKAFFLEEQTRSLSDSYDKLLTLNPELLKKYSKVYFLNENYIPVSLANVDAEFVNGAGRKMQVDARMWPYLKDMLTAAQDEGLSLLVTSAYRSFGTQASLKAAYKVTYGAGTANAFSADQGYSEHQLGTTVDLTTKKLASLQQSFDTSPESKWLTEHAHEYGFVLSYPKNNKYYIYEPWHWRFVGVDLATDLHDQGKYLYDLDQRDIDQYLIKIFD